MIFLRKSSFGSQGSLKQLHFPGKDVLVALGADGVPLLFKVFTVLKSSNIKKKWKQFNKTIKQNIEFILIYFNY